MGEHSDYRNVNLWLRGSRRCWGFLGGVRRHLSDSSGRQGPQRAVPVSALRMGGSGSIRLLRAGQPLPLSPSPPAYTLQTSNASHPRQIQGARAGGRDTRVEEASRGHRVAFLMPGEATWVFQLQDCTCCPCSRCRPPQRPQPVAGEGVTAVFLQRPRPDFTKSVVFPQNTRSFAGITSPSVCRR